ncbi:MAG: hypothetical protein ACKVVP_12310 [Chloroflexota bacterium]
MLLRLLVVLVTLTVGFPSAVRAEPTAQGGLPDPKLLFLDDLDMPRGFQRMSPMDQVDTNPGVITAIRQYSNGTAIIQQIVYAAATDAVAKELGGRLIDELTEQYDAEFGEILTLGERAVSGVGEDSNGTTLHIVVFQRGIYAAAILWIESEGDDLEADTVALAGKMDSRARVALGR